MKPINLPSHLQHFAQIINPALRGGEVVADEHPALLGRVQVQLAGAEPPRWLAVVRGLAPRNGDRVVVACLEDEPVVLAIVDGTSPRPESRARAASLHLRADEVVRICGPDGTLLVEVAAGESGPRIVLGEGDACLRARGTLRLEGEAVEVAATRGSAKVCAHADVELKGETIQLN